jgi:hypothetical protein
MGLADAVEQLAIERPHAAAPVRGRSG